MRTVKQNAVPQDTDLAKFPDGGIKNETATEAGTPVIEEIYGDVLANIYKILSLTKTVPTGDQDNELDQYQIVDALKLLANNLNDKEQVLTLVGTVWSVPFDLDILPDKYVFIAKASDVYDSAVGYTFKGTGAAPTYALTSTGFNASDQILVVIDQAGVRVISLSKIIAATEQTFATFGQPISFNETDVMRYESNGKLLTDAPSIVDLQTQIRALSADPLAEVFDVVILKGFVLCFTYLPNTITYKFYHFDLNDLNTAINVPVTGIVIPVGADNFPYMYTDGTDIYITNGAGTNVTDADLTKLTYTPATPVIAVVSTILLNVAFEKTSNVVVKGDSIYTFVNSILRKYNLLTGVLTTTTDFDTVLGMLIQFNGSVYYINDEVATKWTI